MRNTSGFTIVELIITIVVIGILASIGMVSYAHIQKRASQNALVAALDAAVAAVKVEHDLNRNFLSKLPEHVASPDNIKLTLTTDEQLYYDNLTPVQNGKLLSQICQDLIDEGYGRGRNAGGSTDNYITGCGNWNDDSMQVTGWTSKVFATPIQSSTFTEYADTIPPGDSWHPHRQSVEVEFYTNLHRRFLNQGGSYPITSFWDYWANPGNGGVMPEDLPSQPWLRRTYCIEGYHHRYPETPWYITGEDKASPGSC